jgi:hypothetical protein
LVRIYFEKLDLRMTIYGKGEDQEESFKQQHGCLPLVALGLHKGMKEKE